MPLKFEVCLGLSYALRVDGSFGLVNSWWQDGHRPIHISSQDAKEDSGTLAGAMCVRGKEIFLSNPRQTFVRLIAQDFAG